MLNLVEDQFVDDVVSRAEQSRFSYTLQTEEFRNLNSNLEIYLNDIKKIDDDNRQLQENIEQIRTNYIITLENHLKRLPEDFQQESHILTEAHIERYKFKSRAKRFMNEREELKKRIHFVSSNEKDRIKRLNNLEKQERLVENELKNLNQQIENLYNFVQIEKQTHEQAMNKVDNLQIQLEQICIERSKTEFEIQTLREEVKLMQTAKEFLDEEHQTILSTQTEANEYLLSHLNQSISRIREDFNQLNKIQIKQIENEYKQMIKILEENSLANETTINSQHAIQTEYEKLQNEHQSITQELTKLNEHNHILSEQILSMEADLHSIHNEQIRELINKDNELERSQIELQTLNEKLNHLAEYDRNLKFELTLYRGVLENEYRRKQQQQLNNNHHQIVRPTTLRTTIIKNNKNSSKVLTNGNQLESINGKINAQIDEEKIENKDELDRQNKNGTAEEQHQTPMETMKSPISAVPTDQLSSSEVQQSPRISPTNQEASLMTSAPPPDLSDSLEDHQISLETSNVPTSFTDSILPEDQPASSDIHQSPTPSAEDPILSELSPTNEEGSLTAAPPISSEDWEIPIDTQTLSSIPPSTGSEILFEAQDYFLAPAISEDQTESSEIPQSSSTQLEDRQESSEVPELSTTSPMNEEIPSETEKSSTSPINTTPITDLSSFTLPDDHQMESNIQQSSNISSNEQPMLPESSSMPSQEEESITSDIPEKSSTPSEEQPISSEIQQSPIADENAEEQSSSAAIDKYQTTTTPTTGEVDSENQLAKVSNEHEEKTYETDEIVNDYHQSTQEHETNQTEDNESILEPTEEPISSSDQTQLEKDSKSDYTSSNGYYGSINNSTPLINQELSKQSSPKTSLTDADGDTTDLIGEVGSATSPKNDDKDFDDNNESNLETVMQDLRYVYRSLVNDEDLVEINDDFPDKLIDLLEFGDNVIRKLFDDLLRKYIVQPSKTETHSTTLDWIEFRDTLFPILTGRYMEEHIRKLFNLFDINKNGYLSLEEITELLELLQINNSNELAQNIINQNDKLNVDELIEAIKKIDDVNSNILSDETEYKHWYIQRPTDEENNNTQSISLEVPNINSPLKTSNGIILLSRIFKRIGADVENKQLDSNKPKLSMKITNEFIHNNIHISNDDLQLFIELYLNKKQKSDGFINWIEFRDIFLPFVNNGMVSKDDISRWFDILDKNNDKTISQEQILHLLRLLQLSNCKEIFNKIQEIHPDNNNSWTLEELIFALENIDETTTCFIPTNEQIQSFDLEWFKKNIF